MASGLARNARRRGQEPPYIIRSTRSVFWVKDAQGAAMTDDEGNCLMFGSVKVAELFVRQLESFGPESS
jgi:hypothetical protein